MKEHPTTPGAPAIILYRESYTDDEEALETHHYRIKVLTAEGRKHGDVEILYPKRYIRVSDIEGRVVQPDGAIVPFDGRIYDKLVVKRKKAALNAKTFTLPDVQVGSIIEYRYKLTWGDDILFRTDWVIQGDLFTRRASFGIKPYTGRSGSGMRVVVGPADTPDRRPRIRWVSPAHLQPKEQKGGRLTLQVENVPAFEEEEFMPPEDMLKLRVEFFYTNQPELEAPDVFWKRVGTEWSAAVEQFIGRRKGIEREAAELVAASGTADAKLRKLYARVQQLRNTSLEEEKTEKEKERESLRPNQTAEDVLERGYGTSSDLARLFVALARAAGFEASIVRVSSRDEYFFNQALVDGRQLNREIAAVSVDGRERYFDPGTRFCPYGLLAWEHTGVKGLRLSKDGGTFVDTVLPDSANAVVRRKAMLELDPDGSVRGKVTAAFSGLEGLRWRLDNAVNDETGRRKEMEDEIKRWLPAAAKVSVGKMSNWETGEEPLEVEFDVEIAQYASVTGKRVLLPLAPFQANEQHPFRHADRKYPVYFEHPFQELDEITLKLPEGFRVDATPPPVRTTTNYGAYERSVTFQAASRTLTWRRRLAVEGILFLVEEYPVLRRFFDGVRSGDEQSMVLQLTENRAAQ